jgi:hypothetical protein
MENDDKLFYDKNIFITLQTVAYKNWNSYYKKVNSYISTTK